MKKLLPIAMLLVLFSLGKNTAFSQSQRLVLEEEFTQASCSPCAAANPAFNALLRANTNKVTSIKYQVSWPGVDPMNAQNPTQVATRVTYYNITGVPMAAQDGSIALDPNYAGYPGNITQADIDARYATTSPFTIAVSHVLNSNRDTIFTHTVIKKTGAVSGTLVAQVVVIEKAIHFLSPPGANGEKDFYEVMKQMLPSDQGTPLPAMNVGDSLVLDLSWKMTNVYDTTELAVVSFVQDNGTKEVHQAGYSPIHLQPNDAGIVAITNVNPWNCGTTITPSVTLHNFGTNDITTCTINYKIDNGVPSTLPWAGTLAAGASVSVPLSAITVAAGSHTITSYTTNPNGGTDVIADNNSFTSTFVIGTVISSTPLVEGFENAFPPANWAVYNPDAGYTWTRVTNAGGFGNSSKCAKFDAYDSTPGNIDDLDAASLDMSSTTGVSNLEFNVAYCMIDNLGTYKDTLEVIASIDCGATWTTLYTNTGATLATAPTDSLAFTPTSAQWQHQVVDLTSLNGNQNVKIVFHGISGFGNNIYVDDVNIHYGPAGIPAVNSILSLDVYPNPSNGIVTLSTEFRKEQNLKVSVVNVLGEIVSETNYGKTTGGKYTIDLSDYSAGTYFIKVITDDQTEVKKVTLNK